jgi:alanine dehydrogenase
MACDARGSDRGRCINGTGHFNVLRGHLSVPGVSGVKVVGDFVSNYAAGVPSELGLLTLYDPETGVPLSIMDATLITACRTGAMTAVGARYLARPDAWRLTASPRR